MIDTKDLRRLAQAATPGPWINHGRQPNVAGLPHSAVAAKTLLARVYSEAYGDAEQETANASFIAAANPAAITELIGRLEAAEKDSAHHKALAESALRVAKGWEGKCDALRAKISDLTINVEYLGNLKKSYEELIGELQDERDTLRAKGEAMEKQEPVAWARKLGLDVPSFGCVTDLKYRPSNIPESSYIPLYTLPGAQTQPAQSVPEGWKLVPTAESGHPAIYRMLAALHIADRTAGLSERDSYRAMLAAAPEAKPCP